MRDNPIDILSLAEIDGVGIRDVVVPSHIVKNGCRYEVTGIGRCAFSNCRNIVTLQLPETVMDIKEKAFLGCRNMLSVVLSDSVEVIGDSAFSGCACLNSVRLGSSLKSIGRYAFWGCRNIESLSLPASLEVIGRCAFAGCDSLREIRCDAIIPPRCDEWSFGFSDDIYQRVILRVPTGRCDEYGLAPVWHRFSNIVDEDVLIVKDSDSTSMPFTLTEDGKKVKIYTMLMDDKMIKITIER